MPCTRSMSGRRGNQSQANQQEDNRRHSMDSINTSISSIELPTVSNADLITKYLEEQAAMGRDQEEDDITPEDPTIINASVPLHNRFAPIDPRFIPPEQSLLLTTQHLTPRVNINSQRASEQDFPQSTQHISPRVSLNSRPTTPPTQQRLPLSSLQEKPRYKPPNGEEPIILLPVQVIVDELHTYRTLKQVLSKLTYYFKCNLTPDPDYFPSKNRNKVHLPPKEIMSVKVSTIGDHQTLLKLLEEAGFDYYLFRDPNRSKLMKVVLRGLHRTTHQEDIMDYLKAKGFDVLNVSQMKTNSKEKRPLPLFLITLPDTPQSRTVFQIKVIDYTVCTLEQFRSPNNPLQCYRCQLYSHSAANCRVQPNCVKCSEPHDSRTCPPREKHLLKCYNCKGNHAASYKGCPAYKKAKIQLLNNKQRAQRNAQQQKHQHQQRQQPLLPTPDQETQQRSQQMPNPNAGHTTRQWSRVVSEREEQQDQSQGSDHQNILSLLKEATALAKAAFGRKVTYEELALQAADIIERLLDITVQSFTPNAK